MVTVVTVPTALVVIGKVALVAPAGTVTLAGTVATAVLLLDSATVAPPVGAAPLRVTVPVDELPPVTLVGFSATEDKDRPAAEANCSSTHADCAHTLAPRFAWIITRVAVAAVFSMKASPTLVVPPEAAVA